MPRNARIVLPGLPHHVTQRGNNKQDVFFVNDDRQVYLELLAQHGEQFGLRLDGYCLMTNHVHLIVTPATEDALAKAVGRTHFRYTQYVNRMHGRSGHLWQNRFHSCALQGSHYWRAMAYVERNPVRAKLVRAPWRYPWSSAAAHADGADKTHLLAMDAWRERCADAGLTDWKTFLGRRQTTDDKAAIRLHLSRGRPLADDSFLSKLERTLGRRLRPLPVGRPRKKPAKKKGRNR